MPSQLRGFSPGLPCGAPDVWNSCLTIVKIDNQQVPDGQGGRVAADILTAKAENGTAYTVRLNQVTIGQLVRIFGPDAEIENKRVLASTFEKGDKVYIAFAPPPAVNTPKKPKFLPGAGEGTAPIKDKTQFALNPEAQAATPALAPKRSAGASVASLERTMKTM